MLFQTLRCNGTWGDGKKHDCGVVEWSGVVKSKVNEIVCFIRNAQSNERTNETNQKEDALR